MTILKEGQRLWEGEKYQSGLSDSMDNIFSSCELAQQRELYDVIDNSSDVSVPLSSFLSIPFFLFSPLLPFIAAYIPPSSPSFQH